MLLVYENKDKGISAEWKKTVHKPPHLHEAIEVVYVTDGDIELGVGQELYHMDEGDFAIVFPNVIHHYQVFGKKENKVIYLYLDPTLFPSYYKELQIYSPKNPVVKKEQVHPDVVNAIKYLAGITEGNPMLIQAYVQMILAHVFAPLGFNDWRISTALITGFTAKESVVSTLTVLLGGDTALLGTMFSTKTALVFLVFTLLYTPCVAAIASVRREMGTKKAAFMVAAIQCLIAWSVAFLVHLVLKLI